MKQSLSKSFEDIFLHSWWVILFILLCYLGYALGLHQWDDDFTKLRTQYLELQQEKQKALAQQENLLMQINSQNDPAWIELTLMKTLGLVPEGQTKVLFSGR